MINARRRDFPTGLFKRERCQQIIKQPIVKKQHSDNNSNAAIYKQQAATIQNQEIKTPLTNLTVTNCFANVIEMHPWNFLGCFLRSNTKTELGSP